MSGLKKTVLAASSVSAVLLLSKILGFVREVIIARYFGASLEVDAYQIATIIPLILFNLIFLNAISTVIVPLYTEIKQSKGEKTAGDFINNLASFIILVSLGILITGILSKSLLVKLVAPGFSGDKYLLTVQLTTIMFPMIVISAITGVGTGLLNANRVFWVATLIGVPQNIVIIITVVLLSKTQGIYSLAIGTLLGVGGQLLLVLPWMIRYGYRPRFLPDFKDVNMFKGLKMAGPVIIGSAVYYAGIVVDRIMASGLPDGSIAALNYAFKLNTFVVGIFISAVYLVSLQSLSVLVSKKDYAGFKDAVGENICLMGILIIPMVAGLFVLREQIITVLFKGGSFDEIAVQRTASALGFYSLGLVGISIRDILNSSFYALKDTKSPTINAVIAVILNIVLNLLLIKKIGHTGLALSTSISATVLSLLLFRKIRTKIGSIDEKRMLVTYGKCGAAAFIMGCFAHVIHIFLATLPLSPSLVLVVTIFFSALIYFFLVYIFGVDELVKFKLFLYAKIFKKFHLRGKRGAI